MGRICLGLVLCVASAAGCKSSPWSGGEAPAVPQAASPPAAAQQVDTGSERPAAAPGSNEPDPQAMQAMLAEIQAVHALDPQAQAQLLENLKQTSPDLWPLVVRQFHAALAYRYQAEQRELLAQQGRVSVAQLPPAPQTAPPSPASATPPPATGVESLPMSRPASQMVAPPPGDGAAATPIRPLATARSLPASELPPVAASALVGDASAPPTPSVEPKASEGASDPTVRHASADQDEDADTSGAVVNASYQKRVDGDWNAAMEAAIEKLESEVNAAPKSDAEIAQHARLRMLYLLAGRRDEALKPIPSLAPPMQDFWSKELYGLATLLDHQMIADESRRAAEAKRHLSESLRRLGESSPLVVRNLAFVTEVQSYGAYRPFDKYDFKPGQKVLLYAEVDNFAAKETPRGFHTALRSSYQIFDSRGQRIADHEFSTNEEYCRNPRRDFFIGYEFSLPERIYSGKHVLQLTVADLNSQKIGQSSIEFAVDSPEK